MQASSSSFRLNGKPALTVLLGSFILLATAVAQFSNPQPVPDRSALHPPPGVRVAIIEFDDMECPVCGRVNPLLKEAKANYHAAWIRHDFPLPQHSWSHQAAIDARWFDVNKSKELGDEYRDEVFANQIDIENPDSLRAFTEKFATAHGLKFPFVVDPQGKLDDMVRADMALGTRLGVNETPTIWVVTNNPAVAPVRVSDFTKLYTTLDQAFAETKPVVKPVAKPVKR
jgi:protein-disulfide isomerase